MEQKNTSLSQAQASSLEIELQVKQILTKIEDSSAASYLPLLGGLNSTYRGIHNLLDEIFCSSFNERIDDNLIPPEERLENISKPQSQVYQQFLNEIKILKRKFKSVSKIKNRQNRTQEAQELINLYYSKEEEWKTKFKPLEFVGEKALLELQKCLTSLAEPQQTKEPVDINVLGMKAHPRRQMLYKNSLKIEEQMNQFKRTINFDIEHQIEKLKENLNLALQNVKVQHVIQLTGFDKCQDYIEIKQIGDQCSEVQRKLRDKNREMEMDEVLALNAWLSEIYNRLKQYRNECKIEDDGMKYPKPIETGQIAYFMSWFLKQFQNQPSQDLDSQAENQEISKRVQESKERVLTRNVSHQSFTSLGSQAQARCYYLYMINNQTNFIFVYDIIARRAARKYYQIPQHMESIILGRYLYLLGGVSSKTYNRYKKEFKFEYLDSFWRINSSASCLKLPNLPTPKSNFALAFWRSEQMLLTVGGVNLKEVTGFTRRKFAWNILPNLPEYMSDLTACVRVNTLYAFQGTTILRLDLVSQKSWEYLQIRGSPFFSKVKAAVINEKIVIFGNSNTYILNVDSGDKLVIEADRQSGVAQVGTFAVYQSTIFASKKQEPNKLYRFDMEELQWMFIKSFT